MRKHGILSHGYVDDTQLYIHFRSGDAASLADATPRLEMCIQKIRMWMTANKLKLNDIFAGNCHKSGKYKHSSHNVGEKSEGHTQYKHDHAPTCQSDCANSVFSLVVNK